MKEFWDRWGWAVAFVACALFTARMLWGRSAFCGPESEQCLREWISASSGPLTLLGGAISVYYLNRQTQVAIKGSENDALLRLWRSRAVATMVVQGAEVLRTSVEMHQQIWYNLPDTMTDADIAEMSAKTLRMLKGTIDRWPFVPFEKEVALVETNFDMTSIIQSIDEFQAGTSILAMPPFHQATYICALCNGYSQAATKAANEFLAITGTMIGSNRSDASSYHNGTP